LPRLLTISRDLGFQRVETVEALFGSQVLDQGHP
jgi:hypothetical protein